MVTKKAPAKKSSSGTARDAGSGKFVDASRAKTHPKQTVVEAPRRRKSDQGPPLETGFAPTPPGRILADERRRIAQRMREHGLSPEQVAMIIPELAGDSPTPPGLSGPFDDSLTNDAQKAWPREITSNAEPGEMRSEPGRGGSR